MGLGCGEKVDSLWIDGITESDFNQGKEVQVRLTYGLIAYTLLSLC